MFGYFRGLSFFDNRALRQVNDKLEPPKSNMAAYADCATQMPRLDVVYPHSPLQGAISTKSDMKEFDWPELSKYPQYDEKFMQSLVSAELPKGGVPRYEPEVWIQRQRDILSGCLQAHNPWAGVSRKISKQLDRGLPITNAYCKMVEMCYVPEVAALLKRHCEDDVGLNPCGGGTPLKATFLAEAPALFPVAVAYYIGNRYPAFLKTGKFVYDGTTLPLEAGLSDQYQFIERNKDKWTFMDHTSVADTRMMIEKLGRGSRDLVTGDIGKPITTWESCERNLYREELGQFISACALLREGGVAIVKMFTAKDVATACILRTAIAIFDTVRVFKPRISRPNNLETYWIMAGFKKILFDPLLDPLLDVLAAAKPDSRYPAFLPQACFPPAFEERLRRMLMGQHLRTLPFFRLGVALYEEKRESMEEPYAIQVGEMRRLAPEYEPFVDEWIHSYGPHLMGETHYQFFKIEATKK